MAIAITYSGIGIVLPTIPVLSDIVVIRTTSGIPVVCGILFGYVGALGVALGEFAVTIFRTNSILGPLYRVLGVAIAASIAHFLWGNLGRLSSQRSPTIDSVRGVVAYGIVSLVAVFGMTGVIASGRALRRVAPFYLSLVSLVPGAVLSSFLVGLPTVYLLGGRISEDLLAGLRPRTGHSTLGIILVPILWVLAGSATSIAYQYLRFIPRWVIRRRDFLTVLTRISGTDGLLLQSMIGIAGFFFLLHFMFHPRYDL